MKRYFFKICIFFLMGLMLFSSCESMLEKEFDDTLTMDQVKQDVDLLSGLLWSAYSGLPRNDASFNCVGDAMLDCATDDGMESAVASDIHKMTKGAWGPTQVIDDQWSRLYSGIRKCQLFLSCVDESDVISNNEILDPITGKPTENSKMKDRMKSEALFLQAFMYAELIKRYRDVPFVNSVLDSDPEALDMPRTPYDVIVDSIVAWCDRAALNLPNTYASSTRGHATRGAALMLKSRVLLYAASPLNNPTNDRERWKRAADAAMAVITFSEENRNVYKLNANFANVFTTVYDPEIIFACQYQNRNDVEFMNVPNGFSKGEGHTNPTQDLVDAFEVKVGNKYVPYDPATMSDDQMYQNRDPRLGATVLYNGASFKGRFIETFVGGLDGLNKTLEYTKTGYYLRKFLNPNIDLDLGTATQQRAWIHFRYSEALLNYAEAMNEYLDAPDQSVYDRLNQVRMRAMGDAGKLEMGELDKVSMRKRIRNERRVEFAFEEHRFWDLRRWKVGMETLNGPIHGIRIEKNGGNTTYTRFEVETRIFDERMYLCPISTYSVLKAPQTGQTPGW